MISIVLEKDYEINKNLEEGKIYAIKLGNIKALIPNKEKDSYTAVQSKDLNNNSKKYIENRYTLVKYIGKCKFIELYTHKVFPYISDVPTINELQNQYGIIPLDNNNWVNYELFKKIKTQPLVITNYKEIDNELIKSVLEVNNGNENEILDYISSASSIVSTFFDNMTKVKEKTQLRDELYEKALCDFDIALEQYNNSLKQENDDINNKIQVKLI